MGWDAYALRNGQQLVWVETEHGRELSDPRLRQAFEARGVKVQRLCGRSAFTLGMLHGPFEEMFERGVGVYFDPETFRDGEVIWSPERVQQAQAEADWAFPRLGEDEDEEWLYWTARTFLETCATEGLGIRFSF